MKVNSRSTGDIFNSQGNFRDLILDCMVHLSVIGFIFFLILNVPVLDPPDATAAFTREPACVECHGDLTGRDVMHEPAADACDNCHEPSGFPHPGEEGRGYGLVDSIPALCYYCHEEEGDLPHEHVPFAGGGCMACHDPHGSSELSLLRFPEKQLCLSCHNRTYRTDTSEIINIRRLISGKGKAHTAITEMGCTVCHRAHGSGFRKILVEAFPEEPYVPAETERFGLCFLCHDASLILEEESEWATGFRNGTRNLHQLHINGNKGRNCTLCHDMHGSTGDYLIKESVSFGDWQMEMNFIPSGQGGSCLPGCHGRETYSRQ